MYHDDEIRKLEIEREVQIQKDLQSGNVERIFKAQNYLENQYKSNQKSDLSSVIYNPFSYTGGNGYVEKNSRIGFDTLRAMSRTSIVRAIVSTRKEQVLKFSNYQSDPHSPGWVVRKKRGHFSEEDELSDSEKREIEEIIEFIFNCGCDEWDDESFDAFLRQFVEDSLVLDQGTFEIVYDRGNRVSSFKATDGSTYRLLDRNNLSGVTKKRGHLPKYAQVINSSIVADFYPWELCFGIRNPQTDINSYGYGRSELEDLINTVTDYLNSNTYNSTYFKTGSNPKGFLRVKNLDASRLKEFQQYWQADVAGVGNAHKLPVLDADKIDFVTAQQSNKDMEYSKYQEFLVKIHCAIYKISPEEIGFPIEGMNANSLGGKNGSVELNYSMDKGLKPLLKFIQSKITKYIVSPKSNGKYEFAFVGIDAQTESEELDSDIKKVQNGGMSAGDFFLKYSQRELEDSDILLNPVYVQAKQMLLMGNEESNQFIEETEEVEPENPFEKSLNESIIQWNNEE